MGDPGRYFEGGGDVQYGTKCFAKGENKAAVQHLFLLTTSVPYSMHHRFILDVKHLYTWNTKLDSVGIFNPSPSGQLPKPLATAMPMTKDDWFSYLYSLKDEKICASCWAEMLGPFLDRFGVSKKRSYRPLCIYVYATPFVLGIQL